MSNKTFEPGQEVFFEDGEMAYYIGKVGDYHAVEPVYERHNSEDYYTYTGEPILVGKVYPEPLTVKKSAQIAELDAEIEEKQKKLREVSGELWEAENSQKKMLEVLKRNEALAQIENALDGKITHIVVKRWSSWELHVINAQAYLDTYAPPVFEIRIDFEVKAPKWGYSTRGNDRLSYDCFPFPCKEEAITFIQQQILSEAKEDELAKMHSHSIETIVNNAKKWQVSIPDCFIAAHRKNQLEAAQKAQAAAQAELDKANKALAELGGDDDA